MKRTAIWALALVGLFACSAESEGGAGGSPEGALPTVDDDVTSGGADSLDDEAGGENLGGAPAEVGPIPAPAAPTRPLDDLEALFAQKFRPLTTPFVKIHHTAYHCLAAVSAYRSALEGAAFDPTYAVALGAAARATANALVATATKGGGNGWGLDTSWDAFGDGSTNPASTVYAFQSGLAIWCLAEAADVFEDATYRAVAKKTFDAYRTKAFVRSNQGYTLNCKSCGYSWYSLDASDRGRLVKNTNIEMAVAGLVLDRYGADPAARSMAAASALSHYGEIHTYANYDYLGRHDPKYVKNAKRLDDHNAFEAYLMLRASQILKRDDFKGAAVQQYRAYAVKNNPIYVASAACHFARELPEAKTKCVNWVTANGANDPSGIGLVMRY